MARLLCRCGCATANSCKVRQPEATRRGCPARSAPFCRDISPAVLRPAASTLGRSTFLGSRTHGCAPANSLVPCFPRRSGEIRTPLHSIAPLPVDERRVIAHRWATGSGPLLMALATPLLATAAAATEQSSSCKRSSEHLIVHKPVTYRAQGHAGDRSTQLDRQPGSGHAGGKLRAPAGRSPACR